MSGVGQRKHGAGTLRHVSESIPDLGCLMDENEGAVDAAEIIYTPLYKYKSLFGDSKRHVRDLIVSQSLYFASPGALNDPFDCRPYLETSASFREQQKRLVTAIRWREDMSRVEAKRRAREISPARTLEILHEAAERAFQSAGVFSLTSNPLDLLMWPHYGDSHRGICVRFDPHALMRAGHYPYGVTYADERPICDTVRVDPGIWVHRALMTKGSNWSYEKEARLIQPKLAGSER